jgi:hypothetical protein
MDIREFHNPLRVKPSSVFMFIVVINLSIMLSCEPAPVSGFPVLVIGVCEKGEMACQAAGDTVFYSHYYAVSKPRTTN